MRLHPILYLIFALASILLATSASQAQMPQSDQRLEVALRMIGHQILLNAGDSTSRVLPVEKEDGHYKIQFDTEFQFQPEELVETVNRVIQETAMGGSYILEVKECTAGEVVYSYQVGNLIFPDVTPCKSRSQPLGCYSLVFTPWHSESQFGLSNSATDDTLANTSPKATQMAYPIIAILIASMIGMFVVFRKKRLQMKRDPNVITLGDYHFDTRNTELVFGKQRIELTSKEADLLMLLCDAVNTTIEREVMLHRVWGDEGDYVGRTLDVFISKLRKKLEADPKVKIVNIRGVGYKLVVG